MSCVVHADSYSVQDWIDAVIAQQTSRALRSMAAGSEVQARTVAADQHSTAE